MAKTAAQKAAEETLKKAQEAATSRAGKTTEERLAEAKAAREEKLAAQKAARPDARTAMAAKAEAAELAMGKAFAERQIAENMRGGVDGRPLAGVVGSSVAMWMYDPKTGKKRTAQEIVDAVVEAVLASDDPRLKGVSLDPSTGKPRTWTDAQKVQSALAQLASNAQFEGSRLSPAFEVAQLLRGDSRGAVTKALANRPDLWEYSSDSVGKVVTRKNFEDPVPISTLVLDPTKNQLTPEQLKQFPSITSLGGMAIDPITGFQVMIDTQGRYVLGEQPTGDWLRPGQDYSKYQSSYTQPNYQPLYLGGRPDSLGTDDMGTGGTGGRGGAGGMGGTVGAGDPNTLTAGDGTRFTNFSDYSIYQNNLDEKKANRQSAYDLLYQQFNQYGLGALVTPLRGLITSGASPSEFTIRLRETDAYRKRFAANADRIKKGLAAISEAEYLGLEDQYQNIMRNYGLPAEYYTRGDMGIQEGFNKFIANDVSAAELEDRVLTAQSRVMNANPEVLASLKQFYPGITNGDILAYTLDPSKALTDIKRKVTAAEIGGAATQAGLQTGMTRAEELGAAGITKAQAQQGFGTIAGGLQRGSQLASIYGEDPYTQTTAEKEVFGLAGQTEAGKQRKKLTGLEKTTFSGQTGITSGALARDRAGVL